MTQQNNNVTTTSKPQTAAQWLMDDSFKNTLKQVLPKHLTPERMSRIALSELRTNPKLGQCNPLSFIGAVVQASQLGLEPGVLGKCYLIPYGQNVTFIVGYRGMLDLARRSGEIKNVYACEVCENDFFEYEQGLEPKLVHKPALVNRGKAIAFYAVAHIKDSLPQFDFMSLEEIENVRKSSKSSSSGPWMTHFPEMAKKTVLRRLFKWLPVSVELQTAVTLDEQADLGLQKFDNVIDNNTMNNFGMITNDNTDTREEISGDGEVLLGQDGANATQTPQKTTQVIEQLAVK